MVRDLEGLHDQSIEEITHRMDMYARRFFEHVAGYGVKFSSMLNQNGELATFSFNLSPSYSEEDRANRIAGLQLMNPVSVTMSADDLPSFALNNTALGGIRSVWPDISRQFERILPNEIMDLVEKAAGHSMNSPAAVPHTEQDFKRWYVEDGLPIPGLKHQAIDRYEQQRIAEQKALQEQRMQEFEHGPTDIYAAMLDNETDE